MSERVLLVGLEPRDARVVREGLVLSGEGVATVEHAAAALALAGEAPDTLDAVLVAASIGEPIALAQAIQVRDGDVAVLILADDEGESDLLRALRFAPLVGAHTAVRSRRDLDRLGVELSEAAQAARQRRRHRAGLQTAGRQVAPGDERPLEGERLLGRLVEAAPIGIVTVDANGGIAAWNRHASAALRVGQPPRRFAPLASLFSPADAPGVERLLGEARTPSAEPPSRVFARPARDGSEQYLQLTGGPFASRTGEPGIVLLLDDVTARVRAERERRRTLEAQRFLAETARLLDAPLEPVAMLRQIATLAVPDRAELCVIDLLASDGEIEGVAVASVDPRIGAALERIRREYPVRADGDHPVARVIRTGRSEVLEELTDETYQRIAQGPAHLDLMRKLHYHSALVAPLVARGRTLGAISLLYLDAGRRYTGDDLELLEEVARRAALALDNARLYEREHRIAETLQRSLLPERLPSVAGLELAARYEPGQGDVGGDWYDVVALPDGRIACVVGDVVGRGIEAAATMGQLRNAVRVYALERADPSEVVNRVDSLVDTLGVSEMATLAYVLIDPDGGRIEIASAGHPPPLVLEADGTTRYLESGRSGPLGVSLQGTHRSASEAFAPGALLLLYTDGLVERRGEVIDEGLERLAAAARSAPRALDALADHVVAELLPGPRDDDVALLAIRADEVGARLEVEVPADPDQVALVRRRLRHWLARHGVPAEQAYDIVIAVGEACANAAEHAYAGEQGTLALAARIDDEGLELRVRDHGRWREPVERGRGLGLPLMRKTMDVVELDTGEGGTEVRMRRTLAPRVPA
jgi:PAS domain S-box-containing protein